MGTGEGFVKVAAEIFAPDDGDAVGLAHHAERLVVDATEDDGATVFSYAFDDAEEGVKGGHVHGGDEMQA